MQKHEFSRKILAWFDQHGRKTLPWQQDKATYRVWISEIILQQTQVSTVKTYFHTFITKFPDIESLAKASVDDVLQLWSGLGYYARARNLHRTAQLILQEHQGEFPTTVEACMKLPGIGRSTAGAILSIANGVWAPILDGNVKRVLSRFYCVEGWPGLSKTEAALWKMAEKQTPKERVSDYTQAIMDLGATVCTKTKPNCSLCPLKKKCGAYQQNTVDQYPFPKPSKKLPIRNIHMLLLMDKQNILLEKRPYKGIWGGFWSFPETTSETNIIKLCRNRFGLKVEIKEKWQNFRHTFSHFHLDISPVFLTVKGHYKHIKEEQNEILWHNVKSLTKLGVSAPVKTMLDQLKSSL